MQLTLTSWEETYQQNERQETIMYELESTKKNQDQLYHNKKGAENILDSYCDNTTWESISFLPSSIQTQH